MTLVAVHETGDAMSHNHGCIIIGNPPKGGSGMQVMWAIVLDVMEAHE
jgi:hypothetical protein